MYWQERGPRPGRPCDTSIRVLTFERHEFHVDVLPVSEGSQTQIFLVRRFDVRPGRFLRARSTQCRVQGVAVASLTPSHSGREKDRAWGRGWKWQQLTWPRPHIPPRLKPHLPTLARCFDCQGHGRAHLGALVPPWEQNHSWQVELWDGAMSVTICIYMSCPNVSCVQESICVNLYPFLFLSLRPPSTLKVPVRFYYINVVTGDSVWEPPTRRWKEMVQAGKSTFWLRMETLRHFEFQDLKVSRWPSELPGPPPPPPPPPPALSPQCRNRDTERHLAVMSPCFWRTSTSLMEEILHRLIAAMQPMKMGRLSISSGTGFLPSTASLQIICFKAFGNQKKLLEAVFVALAWLYGGGLHVPHLWKRMPRKSLFLHRPSMCRRKFSLKDIRNRKILKLETAAYRVACSSNSCQDHDEPDPPGFLETGAAALAP